MGYLAPEQLPQLIFGETDLILSTFPFFWIHFPRQSLVGEGGEGLAVVQPWSHDFHERISHERVAAGMDIAADRFKRVPQHYEDVEGKQRGDEGRGGGAVDR